jgi:hypothetical protein
MRLFPTNAAHFGDRLADQPIFFASSHCSVVPSLAGHCGQVRYFVFSASPLCSQPWPRAVANPAALPFQWNGARSRRTSGGSLLYLTDRAIPGCRTSAAADLARRLALGDRCGPVGGNGLAPPGSRTGRPALSALGRSPRNGGMAVLFCLQRPTAGFRSESAFHGRRPSGGSRSLSQFTSATVCDL